MNAIERRNPSVYGGSIKIRTNYTLRIVKEDEEVSIDNLVVSAVIEKLAKESILEYKKFDEDACVHDTYILDCLCSRLESVVCNVIDGESDGYAFDLECSFSGKQRKELLKQFKDTYNRLYESIVPSELEETQKNLEDLKAEKRIVEEKLRSLNNRVLKSIGV